MSLTHTQICYKYDRMNEILNAQEYGKAIVVSLCSLLDCSFRDFLFYQRKRLTLYFIMYIHRLIQCADSGKV